MRKSFMYIVHKDFYPAFLGKKLFAAQILFPQETLFFGANNFFPKQRYLRYKELSPKKVICGANTFVPKTFFAAQINFSKKTKQLTAKRRRPAIHVAQAVRMKLPKEQRRTQQVTAKSKQNAAN